MHDGYLSFSISRNRPPDSSGSLLDWVLVFDGYLVSIVYEILNRPPGFEPNLYQ